MSGAGATILVVEDETAMRRFLRASLASHGFTVLEAGRASEAEALLTSRSPDVVVLDLGLPDGDGIELTRRIRGWSRVPIVVVSARGREDDKVEALDAGADDYLTKPFGVNELLARLRVAIRHAASAEGVSAPQEASFGEVRIDFVRRQVFRGSTELHLTPIEYDLLALFARNAGKVLTHRHILREIWGPASTNQTHYVRVRMAELRKKLEADPSRPRLLVTEPGVGYRLRDREA